jgi:type VI secretion system secreted protein VgrG
MPQQRPRIASISSPVLGPDALMLRRMVATEQLGRPFEYVIDVLSEEVLQAESLLGEPVVVTLQTDLRDQPHRYFHGLVCRFDLVEVHDRYYGYRIVVRPRLWLLGKAADCRVFQKKSALDIVKDTLQRHGVAVESKTYGSYEQREYCIQYCESDLDFISRLMEQEGIYYYFTHEHGKHTMVLADAIGSHGIFMGCASIGYQPTESPAIISPEHVCVWSVTKEIQSGAYTHTDFNFERSGDGAVMKSTRKQEHGHAHAAHGVFDHPGFYVAPGTGDRYAAVRMEEIAARYARREGRAGVRRLHVGSLFSLTDHPWDQENREYLVVAATHTIETDLYESGAADTGEVYHCTFTAIDSQTQYRPPRLTPRPVVQGPQTAIVTSGADSASGIDKYGRVKVKFHWGSERIESCPVRVAQFWAGKNWGAMFLPRAGQEVIVEFLDGDPDRPIVTGRVYNVDNMPPYTLPDEVSKATVKSRSLGSTGSGYNEIRMDDKDGSEELYFHAQKDMNVVVENDEDVRVKNDQKVKVDKTITVEAGTRLTLKCGSGSIVMSNDGSIEVNGIKVTIEGTASLDAKATTTTVKGNATLNLEAGAAAVLKGALVKIN